MSRPHIVILGAGFGGVYVAKKLRSLARRGLIDVTIVNRTNYFLFTPLLHEVATGGLSPRNVAEPLREIFRNTGIHVIQGTIDSINAEHKTVTLNGHLHGFKISYDQLIIATGAETNYYGIPGAEQFSMPLKSIRDAASIRNQIIDNFEEAVLTKDHAERMRLLSFAIVGGGATGVEMAAELSDFVHELVHRYYNKINCAREDFRHCKQDEPTIGLIHMGSELIEMFSPRLRRAAEKRLRKNGVNLHLNTTVQSVRNDSLVTTANVTIPAKTIIWCAGVKAIVPRFEGKGPSLAAGGRMAVDKHFKMVGTDNIFVIGDAAAYIDSDAFADNSKNTKPVPMLAQVAEQQSKTVAYNVIAAIKSKPLRDFHFHSKGYMISVGQWFAIGEIFSFDIAGFFTWWLWRMVYLFYFASWQKRIRIAIEWMLDTFYPRDVTKI